MNNTARTTSSLTSLIRTAAIIYADSNLEARKAITIRRRFIEAIFVMRGNQPLSIQDIIDQLDDELKITFSEDEVREIVSDEQHFILIGREKASLDKYQLLSRKYNSLQQKDKDIIGDALNRYLEGKEVDKEQAKNIVYRYVYFLFNTNTEAFLSLIKGSIKPLAKLPDDLFNNEEIDFINDFLNWDDEQKNLSLYKLSNYCIEYALAVNNSKETVLHAAIRNKSFYIDNALLYRALGINGDQLKRRILTFFKKCIETGQKLYISSISRNEFLETTDYHIDQIKSTTPFGRINPAVFRRIAGNSFYQFYHEWRENRITYGFDTFRAFIKGEYDNLINHFNITEDFKVPFKTDEENDIVDNYVQGIKACKTSKRGSKNDKLIFYDAQNAYWITCLRNNNDQSVEHTKYYFITSDLKLQAWDYSRDNQCQPLTMLPSQWMALLLKYTSRSNDDYKSFVSFLSIPHEEQAIDDRDMQEIMAGISEITEDLHEQENLVSNMFSNNMRDIIKGGNLRNKAKVFAKDKLEQKFVEKLKAKDTETLEIKASYEQKLTSKQEEWEVKLKESDKRHDEEISNLKAMFEDNMRKQRDDKIKDKIESLKESKLLKKRLLISYREKAAQKYRTKIFVIGSIALLCIVTWCYFVYKIGWDIVEPYTYLPPIIYLFLQFLYFMVKGHSFNPQKYFKQYEDKLYKSLCIHNEVFNEDLTDIQQKINELENQMKE